MSGSEDEIDANLFGDIDYARLTEAIAFTRSGRPFQEQLTIAANQTQEFDLDFGRTKAALLFIQVVAASGTTDLDLSIHESDQRTKADKVFGVENVSVTDPNPTGGTPTQGGPLPYVDLTETDTLHVKTTENSGNNGAAVLRIKYI